MNKGGQRRNAGRPPKYGKGVPLKVVRVPAHLVEAVQQFCKWMLEAEKEAKVTKGQTPWRN